MLPNKSVNPTPGNFRAGKVRLVPWRRELSQASDTRVTALCIFLMNRSCERQCVLLESLS